MRTIKPSRPTNKDGSPAPHTIGGRIGHALNAMQAQVFETGTDDPKKRVEAQAEYRKARKAFRAHYHFNRRQRRAATR